MTYSIVARDPGTGELGVAVQTRWFNVGSVVPWVKPGVGAVATQSFVEVAHGPNGLALLGAGCSPAEALERLLAADPGEAVRQVGIVDAVGRSAAHTGLGCVRWAGHLVAPGVTVQANMMTGPGVPAAMLAAFRGTEGDLAARLLAALAAAERAGGDVRGRQSAALVVTPAGSGSFPGEPAPVPVAAGTEGPAPGIGADGSGSTVAGDPERAAPWTRRFDLRAEDSRTPLDELARLLAVARAYEAFGSAEDLWAIGDADAGLERIMAARSLAPADDQLVLWHAVGLAIAGRPGEARAVYREALDLEARSAEHLRRFAEAGHLPGGAATLRALGVE